MALFLIILLSLFIQANSEELYIASASSLSRMLPKIVKEFRKENPDTDVKISFASSGHLYAQIKGGAPYHVFVSVDTVYPKKLVEEGSALKESYTEYAIGILALYGKIKSGDVVRSLLEANKIAIASPKHAPYGRAAIELIKSLNLLDKVKAKLVYGANVSQAVQFVHTGGVDVGIVAYSLVYDKENTVPLPDEQYPKVRHAAVITLEGKDENTARKFIDFLTSKKAKEIIKEFGFKIPQ
jgi:molybdate transport system substrate-binding protein